MSEVETFCYIVGKETSQVKKNKGGLNLLGKKDNAGDSIWKEKEESSTLNKDNDFRPGTLNSLIIRMSNIGRPVDKDCISTFFTVVELFAESKEVWDKIKERFFVPKGTVETDQHEVIKMRVTNLLCNWLKTTFHSIEPGVLGSIEKFADKTLKKDYGNLCGSVKKELDFPDRFYPFNEKEKSRISLTVPKQVSVLALQAIRPYEILLGADSKIVAEQITLLEFEIYRRITRTELINLKWSKEKLQVLSRNVNSLVQRSDRLAYFVATSILLQKKLKDRAKVLASVIRTAAALDEMRNFNGLMGVLMGLTLSSVQRLRHTWGRLNPKYEPLYNQLAQTQDPSNNFKNYRESVKLAGAQCVPYFTLYLSDFTFIDEGNPNTIQIDNMELINFPKHQMVFRTVKTLEKYQLSNKYDNLQQKDPYYTILHQMPGLDEKELYQLSLEREPRNIQLRELELKERQKD
jgi:hypothetical protein